MSTTIATAEAKKIDTRLAELYTAQRDAQDKLERHTDYLHSYASSPARYVGRRRVYTNTPEESIAAVEAKIAADGFNPNRDTMAAVLTTYADTQAAIAKLQEDIDPLEALHAAHGWSRFFLVADGHIHASTRCHSLRWTTRLGWLPALSGETEKDAVDEHGTILCTFCFPSAPVEWTVGPQAKVDPDTCSGSGQTVVIDGRRTRSGAYVTCPGCEDRVYASTYGKIRKHKTPKK